MSVEKHNNNFFLYALGSAFMLVSGAVLLASPDFDIAFKISQYQTASVVQSLESLEPTTTPGSISGAVVYMEEQTITPLANVPVVLFILDDSGVFVPIQTMQTNGAGQYNFVTNVPAIYRIAVPWGDTFQIILPQQSISGFDIRQTTQEISVDSGEDISDIDFVAILISE